MTRHLGLSTRANSRFLRFLCSIKNLFYLDLNIETKTLVVKSGCRDPAADVVCSARTCHPTSLLLFACTTPRNGALAS